MIVFVCWVYSCVVFSYIKTNNSSVYPVGSVSRVNALRSTALCSAPECISLPLPLTSVTHPLQNCKLLYLISSVTGVQWSSMLIWFFIFYIYISFLLCVFSTQTKQKCCVTLNGQVGESRHILSLFFFFSLFLFLTRHESILLSRDVKSCFSNFLSKFEKILSAVANKNQITKG